jgi:hypothetical protein
MPDPSHVGRRYRAVAVVDGERVARFAAAVGGADGAPPGGGVPPTFAAVYCLMPTLAQVFADADLGMELAGLIHAEQSFTWPTPVRTGDVIDATAEIVAVETKRGLTFVTVQQEAQNQAGQPVCGGRSLLLLRGGNP